MTGAFKREGIEGRLTPLGRPLDGIEKEVIFVIEASAKGPAAEAAAWSEIGTFDREKVERIREILRLMRENPYMREYIISGTPAPKEETTEQDVADMQAFLQRLGGEYAPEQDTRTEPRRVHDILRAVMGTRDQATIHHVHPSRDGRRAIIEVHHSDGRANFYVSDSPPIQTYRTKDSDAIIRSLTEYGKINAMQQARTDPFEKESWWRWAPIVAMIIMGLAIGFYIGLEVIGV